MVRRSGGLSNSRQRGGARGALAYLAGRGNADHDPQQTPNTRATRCSGPPHPMASRSGALAG